MTKTKTKTTQSYAMRLLLGAVACFVIFTIFGTAETFAKDRKYGLFIGINDYPGTENDLSGTVNDAKGWRSAMIDIFNFEPSDTRMLLDKQATRQNIISNINNFAIKAERGDLFVVTYSGHGTLFPDEYSEEIDEKKKTFVDLWFGDDHYELPSAYYDSAICPVDSDGDSSGKSWGNLILDDELYNLFSQFAAKGVKVVFISDSCHSGTIAKGEKKDVSASPRFAPLNLFFNAKTYKDIKFEKPGLQKKVEARMVNGLYLTMSGSQDSEVSWDYRSSDGRFFGMFTNTALSILKSKGAKAKDMTYTQFMSVVQDSVVNTTEADFPTTQTPQLNKEFGNADTKIFQP